MGWFGYGIYDGDGTQSAHYDFIKQAKISKDQDEISEWLKVKRTSIPADKRHLLEDNIDLILKKMPKVKYWSEDKAIEWQMLAALFMDNKVKPLPVVYEHAISATEYLMGDHCDDFKVPSRRRQVLKNFKRKLKKSIEYYYPVVGPIKPQAISVKA